MSNSARPCLRAKYLLPEDIADELVKLQDKVPPFCNDIARDIIEKELGMSISEAFAEFDSRTAGVGDRSRKSMRQCCTAAKV